MTTITTRATKGTELTHNEGDANLSKNAQAKVGNYTVAEGDNNDTIQCAGTFTVTLPDAAAIVAAADSGDFEVILKVISGTITVGRTTGTDTIDGTAANITLVAGDTVLLKVNQAGNGYNITNTKNEFLNITNGTVAASKAVVVDANKDALGFRKITASAASGTTIEATSTVVAGTGVFGNSTDATGAGYGVRGDASGPTGIGTSGYAAHTTGANRAGSFTSLSSAGTGVYAETTVAGGVPIKATAFDAADANRVAELRKGGYSILFNPRHNASLNPIIQGSDQVIMTTGAAGAIDTGVLVLAPYATDAVGIRIDSTTDTVTMSGIANFATNWQILGVTVTPTAAKLNYSDITTLGTAQASRVLTLDASSNLNGTVTSATIGTANVTTKLALTVATGATIIKRILGSTPIIAEATAFADANIYHDAYAAGALAVLYIGTAVATGDIRLNYTTNAVTSTVFSRIIKNGSFYDGFSNAGLGVETRNVLVPVVRGDIVTMQFCFATAGTHTVYNVNVSASTDTVGIV